MDSILWIAQACRECILGVFGRDPTTIAAPKLKKSRAPTSSFPSWALGREGGESHKGCRECILSAMRIFCISLYGMRLHIQNTNPGESEFFEAHLADAASLLACV